MLFVDGGGVGRCYLCIFEGRGDSEVFMWGGYCIVFIWIFFLFFDVVKIIRVGD